MQNFQNKSTWFARSCSHFRGMCKLGLILSHCTRLDLQSKQDENAQNAQRLDQNAWERWFPRNMHFSAPCAGVLRVQYNRAHNYVLLLPLAKVQALSEAQLPFYDLLWEAQGYFYCRRGERRDWCRCLQMFGSVHSRVNGIVVLLVAHQLRCLVLPQAHQLHFSIIIIALEWGWGD